MEEEYIDKITEYLRACHDIGLLDLILKLLEKSIPKSELKAG